MSSLKFQKQNSTQNSLNILLLHIIMQLHVHWQITQESLFLLDLVLEIQERIVDQRLTLRVTGVPHIDLLIPPQLLQDIRNISTHCCGHRGLDQHLSWSAKNRGHTVLVDERPPERLQIDVRVPKENRHQTIVYYREKTKYYCKIK